MTISIQGLLVFLVVSYAVVLSPFLDAGLRNYLILLAALIGVISLFAFRVQKKSALIWSLVLSAYMAVVILATSGFAGLGPVALTITYMMGLVAIISIANRHWFDLPFATILFARIVVAYAIVSVLQMVASLGGLPIPNLIVSKGMWSYNSLAIEPSHLGRAVGITMLAYLILASQQARTRISAVPRSSHRKVLIAFFVTMLLSGSALAVIAIPITLMFALRPVWSVPLLAVTFLSLPFLSSMDYEPVQRATAFLSNLGSLDFDSLTNGDASGASRLIPTLIYLDIADPSTSAFWFGAGEQGSRAIFAPRIGGIANYEGGTGFLPGFLATYGTIASALFLWAFMLRQWNRKTYPIIIFWLCFFSSVPWNTQLFWYGLVTLALANAALSKNKAPLDASPRCFPE